MPANEVKIEYSNMKAIQSSAEDLREKSQQLLTRINDQIDTLKADNWVGDNADTFFQKMDGEVVPGVDRLVNALSSMSDTIDNVMRIFEAAEDEAQGIFPGN